MARLSDQDDGRDDTALDWLVGTYLLPTCSAVLLSCAAGRRAVCYLHMM